MYEDPRYPELVCSDRNLRSKCWIEISDRAATAGGRISHLHFTEYVLRYISLFCMSVTLGGAVKRQDLQST